MNYTRHYYRLHLNDGRFFDFLDYEYMRAWWMHHKGTGFLYSVEIKDITGDVLERIADQKKALGLD